jgi:hypothetical protein
MFVGLLTALVILVEASGGATSGGPQVSLVSPRALMTAEGGGPRCIARFEKDGRFSLPEQCKARMPVIKDASTWSLAKGRLILRDPNGKEVTAFAAQGRVWRSEAVSGAVVWIVVFMRIDAEPH